MLEDARHTQGQYVVNQKSVGATTVMLIIFVWRRAA
jgi:hypothetical protein